MASWLPSGDLGELRVSSDPRLTDSCLLKEAVECIGIFNLVCSTYLRSNKMYEAGDALWGYSVLLPTYS